MKKRMFILITVILPVLAGVGLLILQKYRSPGESSVNDQGSTAANQSVTGEFDPGIEGNRNPGDDRPPSVALQEAAMERMDELIDSEESPERKRQIAASGFMGFYLANTRIRSDICKEADVDIDAFETAFILAHQVDYELAVSLLFGESAQIEKLYEVIKPQVSSTIRQDLQDMATAYQLMVADVCHILDDNAEAFVEQMQFSVVQPRTQQLLRTGK